MPKRLAHRLLEPALQMSEPYRIVCHEWRLDSLLSELAIHRLDLVIADSPIPDSVDVRAFNHRLGESPMAFFASRALAQRCRRPFPACLDAMPMLLPGADSVMRARIMRWLGKRSLQPRIVGEFDGSSLMAAFGEAGFGVFAAPSILSGEMCERHDVVSMGETRELRSEYFAISVERRLTHPCVLAITQSARHGIFNAPAA
jgi:LysR family transcriptional activator of nhaA